MVRRGAWKYTYFHEEPPTLFNLEDDPGEFRDLAKECNHRLIRDELRDLVLDGWDPRQIRHRLRRHQERLDYLQRYSEAAALPDPDEWEGMKGPFPKEWKENARSLVDYAEWQQRRDDVRR